MKNDRKNTDGKGLCTMKILVLSDSHSSLRFMRCCVDAVKPDAIVHLGDYYDDATALHETYPNLALYQVPGNCDRYRCPENAAEILITSIGGVAFYMTHGHKHGVKQSTSGLIAQARACKVQAVLFGHTHTPECYEEDGMWVLNPGSCGYYGGTAGLIVTENGKIRSCAIVKERDLEVFG